MAPAPLHVQPAYPQKPSNNHGVGDSPTLDVPGHLAHPYSMPPENPAITKVAQEWAMYFELAHRAVENLDSEIERILHGTYYVPFLKPFNVEDGVPPKVVTEGTMRWIEELDVLAKEAFKGIGRAISDAAALTDSFSSSEPLQLLTDETEALVRRRKKLYAVILKIHQDGVALLPHSQFLEIRLVREMQTDPRAASRTATTPPPQSAE